MRRFPSRFPGNAPPVPYFSPFAEHPSRIPGDNVNIPRLQPNLVWRNHTTSAGFPNTRFPPPCNNTNVPIGVNVPQNYIGHNQNFQQQVGHSVGIARQATSTSVPINLSRASDQHLNAGSVSLKSDTTPSSGSAYQAHSILANNVEKNSDILLAQNFCTSSANTKPRDGKHNVELHGLRLELKVFLSLFEELKNLRNVLNNTNASDVEFSTIQPKVENVVAQLHRIKKEVSSDVLHRAVRQLKQRRSKRLREKKHRIEKHLQKEEQTARCQREHERIDKWQQQIQTKLKKEKQSREIERYVDETLKSVRQRVKDAEHALRTFDLVRQLRGIRQKQYQLQSLYTTRESDSAFEERLKSLEKLVHSQLESYVAEQAALQTVLDKEASEIKKLSNENSCLKKDDRLSEEEKLFYSQGDASEKHFVATRRLWDVFVQPPNSEAGSCIPLNWVASAPPSSQMWQRFLCEEKDA